MTSIEWLIEQIDISNPFMLSESDILKAKEIHKKEIINAWKDGYGGDQHDEHEYYNETFKKD